MSEENQIVDVENTASNQNSSIMKADDNILSTSYVEQVGKQIELRRKLLQMGLKALKPHDIQDFGGKPYIEGEGAARIMSAIRGFKVHEPKFAIEKIDNDYFVECVLPMEFLGATVEALGDCSTADVFISGADGQGGRKQKHLERTKSPEIAARMMLSDAKKQAQENAISRGVTFLLGIKGLSWEDLKELGFNQSEAGAKVVFKTGSHGGEVKTLTVEEALKAAKDSIVNIRGKFLASRERPVKDKKIAEYNLEGGLIVQKWGSVETGFLAGQELFCSKVKVSEYQGKKQYTAESIDLVEEPVE